MKKQPVYTTGQVAEICGCSAKTVAKWFDDGKIKGHRIPGTQDRRIPHEHLAEFLRRSGSERLLPGHRVPAKTTYYAKIELMGWEDRENFVGLVRRLQEILSSHPEYGGRGIEILVEEAPDGFSFHPNTALNKECYLA